MGPGMGHGYHGSRPWLSWLEAMAWVCSLSLCAEKKQKEFVLANQREVTSRVRTYFLPTVALCHHSEGRRLESGDGEQRTLTDISKKKMFHVSCGVSCISKLQPRQVDPAGFRCSLVAYQIQNEKINRCTAYPFRNRIISASVFGISS